MGQRFSNVVLQSLLVLLKKRPPPGKKLLIIGTSSNKSVLGMMGMLDAFSTTLHVDAITDGDQIMRVLDDVKAFNEAETAEIRSALKGPTLTMTALGQDVNLCIGVKKVFMLIEMARQEEDGRAAKFLYSLYEECRYATAADM